VLAGRDVREQARAGKSLVDEAGMFSSRPRLSSPITARAIPHSGHGSCSGAKACTIRSRGKPTGSGFRPWPFF
jgi:hypothetical protein